MAPMLHKIAFGGKLGSIDQWVCALHFFHPQAAQKNPELLATTLTSWMGNPVNVISQSATLEFIKLNAISQTDGKYLDTTQSNTFVLQSPVAGKATEAPSQLSLSVGLMTAVSRGRGSKGRVYPPSGFTASSFSANMVSALVAKQCADGLWRLVQDINTALGGEVVVWSQIGQNSNVVTGTRCGRIYDTQRRRRNSFPEDYQYSPGTGA